jgi:hypothetical protein
MAQSNRARRGGSRPDVQAIHSLQTQGLVTSWSEISRLAHREAADGSLWGATFLG